MSEELKKLLELASEDQALAKEVQTADKEALIRLAKERGITLTEEDFQKPENEMSEEELDIVSGGQECGCAFVGVGSLVGENAEMCVCAYGGGGTYTSGGTRCVCVVGGYGKD